ncbi:MAG: hypothetical protein ABIU63_14910 [Chitinophagaceae bacterium]
MTKLFSKKLWIALISCCGIGGGIAFACADGWGEEYGVSNFSPEIFVDSAYSPFFYSSMFYYKINFEENQHSRFNDKNVQEWAGFFKGLVSKDALQYFLQTATDASIDSAARWVAGKSAPMPLSVQSFNALKQNNSLQLTAFFNYLQLAKKSEAFALNDIQEPWNTDSTAPKKTYAGAAALNRDLLTAFSKTTDAFLKERIWFQLVRSYFFNGNPQQAIDLYTSTEKSMPHNDIYFRTLAYTAGAFYKLRNFSKANYYYSLAYDGCDALKTVAHYSFHPQEEKDWNATLALCRNNDEQATLWQMLGVFYADEQRAISEIYRLNPLSDKLDLLLGRAINKYEQKFTYRGDAPSYMPFDTSAASKLPALVTKIATAANTRTPWIWEMAAGYVNTLDQKYAAAAIWFARAEKSIPAKKEAQAQLRLLKLINNVGQAKRIDASLEKSILADMEWLKNFDASTMPELRYRDAFEWIKQKLAAKYLQQKEWVKSECFYSQSAFYATNKNVEALKIFLGKINKTPYEKLCAAFCVTSIADLFEYQAVQLTYADSIDVAIGKMLKAGPAAAYVLPGNPFNGRIQDCHDCDHAAAQKIKYTKLSLLQKIKELKDKLNAGTDVYSNALLLANAAYNISHFGNARFFYEGKIIGLSPSSPTSIDSVFRSMLTGMEVASKYYNLCLQYAATDEQKAKCQYMLAKCQRNAWYFTTIYKEDNPYSDKPVDFIAWDGFKALKQYSNSQYYKEVIKECGYFKTYSLKGR